MGRDGSRGSWHKAREVPGSAALNVDGGAEVFSVSCASPGNCAVGGSYEQTYFQAFVANEVKGVWHRAQRVAGLPATANGQVNSVSCGSPGNCSAGGSYTDASGYETFIADEVSGQAINTAIFKPCHNCPGP